METCFMKKSVGAITVIASLFTWGCTHTASEYVDLNSGQKITVEKNNESGYMVNKETGKPVYLYVDVDKRDTFYGRTGKLANNSITRDDNGMFRYGGDDEYEYSNDSYNKKTKADDESKIKVQDDGDVKMKDGDKKAKIEKDGDIKIKDGDKKIKIEDGKAKVKKDE
jgi:hypothetical protein